MSNIESAMRFNQERRNEATVKQLDTAGEENTTQVEGFADSPVHRADIPHDTRYVKGTETVLNNTDKEQKTKSTGLERLFQFGIAQGDILNDPKNQSYETEPIWTNKYDDYRNCIDAAATIHARPESNSAHEAIDITFGIDLTIDPTPSRIRNKLLIASNEDNLGYPAGFSRIKYFQDSTGAKSIKELVPRYCIGMSDDAVDDYLEATTLDRNGVPHVREGAQLIPNFKILYEMSKQNELYEIQFYKKIDADIELTETEELALKQMSILDNIYLRELGRIAKKMPAGLISDCLDKSGNVDIDALAQKFIFPEGDERKHDDYGLMDRTFTNILREVEQLAQESDDSDDPDYLKQAGIDALKAKKQKHGKAALAAAS